MKTLGFIKRFFSNRSRPRHPHVMVEIHGGLGRQMFQYATGRALASRLGVPLYLDIAGYSRYKCHSFALAQLQIKAQSAKSYRQILREGDQHLLIVRESEKKLAEIQLNGSASIYLSGYWQDLENFSGIRLQLLNEFRFKRGNSVKRNVIGRIGKEDVCLYLPDDLWELNVNTGWLDEALSEMRRRIKEGKTVVLSSSWSADSLQMFGDFDFISTDKMTEPQILEILSGFKNFVIPPSELAWWAAWLAEEGGIKVAMKRWFPFNDRQIPNLLPSDWIQV